MKYFTKTITLLMCIPFWILFLTVLTIVHTIYLSITKTKWMTEEQMKPFLLKWFDITMKTSWVFYLIVIIWYLS